MAKNFAQTMSDAQLMAIALKANSETLKKRGITQEFIDRLNGSLGCISTKNSEKEKHKASLQTATADLDTLLKQLNTLMQEAVKVVKLEIPQARWKEFGIQAKR